MAESCETYLAKQKAIDATFVSGAERIRKAYLVRLKEAHADAKLRGQSELADSITEQAEAAAELDDWLPEMGIEDGTMEEDEDEEDEDDRGQSGFSGKWLWNKSPYVIWEVSPAGTLFCRAWGNLQGNWTEHDGEILVTWRSGGTANLKKRGARWVGTNAKGDKIQLSRAD